MRYKKLIFWALGAVVLVGCTNHNKDYIREAQAAQPLVSSTLKPEESFYPVPQLPPQNVVIPSLVPPGSHLERFKKQS